MLKKLRLYELLFPTSVKWGSGTVAQSSSFQLCFSLTGEWQSHIEDTEATKYWDLQCKCTEVIRLIMNCQSSLASLSLPPQVRMPLPSYLNVTGHKAPAPCMYWTLPGTVSMVQIAMYLAVWSYQEARQLISRSRSLHYIGSFCLVILQGFDAAPKL